MLSPVYEEIITGQAVVREIFKILKLELLLEHMLLMAQLNEIVKFVF